MFMSLWIFLPGWSLGEACQEKGETTQEHPKTGTEGGNSLVQRTPSVGLLGLLFCGCVVVIVLYIFIFGAKGANVDDYDELSTLVYLNSY